MCVLVRVYLSPPSLRVSVRVCTHVRACVYLHVCGQHMTTRLKNETGPKTRHQITTHLIPNDSETKLVIERNKSNMDADLSLFV